MKQDILLDTGTNEVELLEFFIGSQSFGINVSKILQILPFDNTQLTTVPDAPDELLGVILWREKTIKLIDLHPILSVTTTTNPIRPVILVTSFNNQICAFLTDGVTKIHRISWTQISPVGGFLEGFSTNFTGSVHLESQEMLLIDFEYVLSQLIQPTEIVEEASVPKSDSLIQDQLKKQIILIEDSKFIRETITHLLDTHHFHHIKSFENGAEGYQYIMEINQQAHAEKRPITDDISAVVCDIEMPQLDGLTFTYKVRKEMGLITLPIVILSSLISDQMNHKCREVGASAYLSKSQPMKLIKLLMKLFDRQKDA